MSGRTTQREALRSESANFGVPWGRPNTRSPSDTTRTRMSAHELTTAANRPTADSRGSADSERKRAEHTNDSSALNHAKRGNASKTTTKSHDLRLEFRPFSADDRAGSRLSGVSGDAGRVVPLSSRTERPEERGTSEGRGKRAKLEFRIKPPNTSSGSEAERRTRASAITVLQLPVGVHASDADEEVVEIGLCEHRASEQGSRDRFQQ